MPVVSSTPVSSVNGLEHLWRCGFAHRDYLESLADENGNIHVSKLPVQEIKYRKPFRGPNHHYNNAARWAKMNEPDPEPVHIPNIRELTTQENHAMLEQYRRDGWLKEKPLQGRWPQ